MQNTDYMEGKARKSNGGEEMEREWKDGKGRVHGMIGQGRVGQGIR